MFSVIGGRVAFPTAVLDKGFKHLCEDESGNGIVWIDLDKEIANG